MVKDVFVPTEKDESNLRIPLYAAFGITKAESDAVNFAVTEDIVPMRETVAECLKAISERKGWSDKQRIWAAYNLKTEILVRKGVPRGLLERLEIS